MDRQYECSKCGREMATDLVGLPHDEGARVLWHKDGTPDNCDLQKDIDEIIEALQDGLPHEPWTVTALKRIRKFVIPRGTKP